MAPRPSSVRISYRPKRSRPRSSIGVLCGVGASAFVKLIFTGSARGRFHLALDCGDDPNADYVFAQHVSDFSRLIWGESIEQLKSNLNALQDGDGVMMQANLDGRRTGLTADGKTNTRSFCRRFFVSHASPNERFPRRSLYRSRPQRGLRPSVVIVRWKANRTKLPSCLALRDSMNVRVSSVR